LAMRNVPLTSLLGMSRIAFRSSRNEARRSSGRPRIAERRLPSRNGSELKDQTAPATAFSTQPARRRCGAETNSATASVNRRRDPRRSAASKP
jgi:hypothetical protein